jgi:hypothetical protein
METVTSSLPRVVAVRLGVEEHIELAVGLIAKAAAGRAHHAAAAPDPIFAIEGRVMASAGSLVKPCSTVVSIPRNRISVCFVRLSTDPWTASNSRLGPREDNAARAARVAPRLGGRERRRQSGPGPEAHGHRRHHPGGRGHGPRQHSPFVRCAPPQFG